MFKDLGQEFVLQFSNAEPKDNKSREDQDGT